MYTFIQNKIARTTFFLFFIFVQNLASSGLANAALIPEPPALEATAFLLMDAKTGKIITSYNPDQKVHPASLTKMMTSYIVTHELSKGNIKENDQVQISVKAWKAEGSRMFVREGTYVSVMDLLKGVIISSGNDASIALAEHVAGSEEAFADLMNRYAQELGMNDTHFINSTGLPDEQHMTTVNDLAKLAQAIIYQHPEYYHLYSQTSMVYGGINQPNRNTLIFGEMPVDGLKTGHTEEAGYCLVASAEQNNTRLISVIMGAKSEKARAEESKKLLTYGFRFFETAKLYAAKDVISEQKLWMGENETIALGAAEDLFITIPRGSKNDLKATIDVEANIRAPIKAGDKLGTLTITQNDQTISQTPLVAINDENKGGIFKRLIDLILLFFAGLKS